MELNKFNSTKRILVHLFHHVNKKTPQDTRPISTDTFKPDKGRATLRKCGEPPFDCAARGEQAEITGIELQAIRRAQFTAGCQPATNGAPRVSCFWSNNSLAWPLIQLDRLFG